MHREPEVPEEWLDCRARITSKELAPLHPVKNGILQNACSTSPKRDTGFGKSALMRIDKLVNTLVKGLKKNDDKKCSDYVEKYTTVGLRISRYGAAEVFIDFVEELKHTEANPMCVDAHDQDLNSAELETLTTPKVQRRI